MPRNLFVICLLRMAGASIRSQNGTSSSGFLFNYTSGKTVGSVSIHPLALGVLHGNMPLQAGLEDMALSIEIKEEWYPNGIPAEVARALPQPAR